MLTIMWHWILEWSVTQKFLVIVHCDINDPRININIYMHMLYMCMCLSTSIYVYAFVKCNKNTTYSIITL